MTLSQSIVLLFLLLPLSVLAQKDTTNAPKSRNVDHKTRILKVTPLAFGSGYTTFAYEKSLRPKRSYEIQLALVGLGVPRLPNLAQRGATVTFGYKFIEQPTEPPKRNRYRHVLRGRYFRPDVTLALYKEKYENLIYTPNVPQPMVQKEGILVSYLSVVPTIGYQKVRRKGFVTDVFVGAGLAAVYPMNGGEVLGVAYYTNLIPFDRSKGEKLGVSYALKLGFRLGGVF
ncbi:MAG: hypothetical protein U5L45_08160 [Saprospiraceae bacterium]|nr:hypothetical protein [Saprospiraceae bacterium]